MASVFTYDPDPPRVSSPWSTPPVSTPRLDPVDHEDNGISRQLGGLPAPPPITLAECGISKLEAEPQEGPTEYKLHLLLRPRRSFTVISTGATVSGSYRRRSQLSNADSAGVGRRAVSAAATPTLQSRQNRLQHLTTQLLWRLQQSSPYHSSSTADLVLPRLPEANSKLGAPLRPEKLLPGLEESRGALYEIGVSDDGTFVGLTEDEMHESLTNLRAMAASLGCNVNILRTVIVGECEWSDEKAPLHPSRQNNREDLLVSEVLILPDTDDPPSGPTLVSPLAREAALGQTRIYEAPEGEESRTEQLRVSLTGSTTSGKSSLLGTLSTSTLDNGRGKSRLSLLKHRHEIASGVTSSVAPELIGYRSLSQNGGNRKDAVVNYGCGNVSSWNDIHNTAEGGRLVFLVDSAGHPRFRRTTVRGLVSWAPHWTLCCIAADDSGAANASASPDLIKAELGSHLSRAHLELCLKLDLSLVVVITKYDLASKGGLRNTLAWVLSIVKDAGRTPVLLKPNPRTAPSAAEELQAISASDEQEVVRSLSNKDVVPIVLTSAVTGDGISKLHALLRHLPIPSITKPLHSSTKTLFHIDEVYTKPPTHNTPNPLSPDTSFLVLSGHLRYGSISVGDTLLLGPFAWDPSTRRDEDHSSDFHRARSYPSRLAVSSSPAGHSPLSRRISGDFSLTPCPSRRAFLTAKVLSLRNLRLPLRRLHPGQAGTVGIELTSTDIDVIPRARKGMVLGQPCSDTDSFEACSGFVARFKMDDYLAMQPGGLCNVYVASVRANAKIISVEAVEVADEHAFGSRGEHRSENKEGSEGMFGFDDDNDDNDDTDDDCWLGEDRAQESVKTSEIDVVFHLVGAREWIEPGAQILVMPANVLEKSIGLDGYVGSVVEVVRE